MKTTRISKGQGKELLSVAVVVSRRQQQPLSASVDQRTPSNIHLCESVLMRYPPNTTTPGFFWSAAAEG
ncbi:hypothetical protein JKF63_04568 [Porcisia hertigi]|uniref:Uncharacterized protein n=1 Tax=Porcisia hertigi TaxID=2761500 RepID=A0A836IF85_9TRYP|nr:hypothetical protein JKF63_04568 [Porcisia hertigi]